MIDKYTEIMEFIADYLMAGIFMSVLVIILAKVIFKNKIDTYFAADTIKWILIIYSIGVPTNFVLVLILDDSKQDAFLDRATGPYWWAYWLMLVMNALFPLLLLIKKLGSKLYFLLIVAILMNIGWIFESFVIHMTSMHSDYLTEDYNPYLPNSRETAILINGSIWGLIALVMGNFKKIHQNKTFLLCLIFLPLISCQSQNVKSTKTSNSINCNGIYVSRDTLYSLDKQYKNEITLRLLKFNKDLSVQISTAYVFLEGEEKLNNSNLTNWLDIEAKYNYTIKNKKLIIQCYSKQPKRAWNDFATGGDVTIKEIFKIEGNTIYKTDPFFNHQNSRKKFSKRYILDETLTGNHKNVRKGNGCAQNW